MIAAHELLDEILEVSPRKKFFGTLFIALFFGSILAFAFYLGVYKGRGWADSKYLQDRLAREKVIAGLEADAARHDENQKQLAAENSLLKKQSEMQADALIQSDNQRKAGNAADLKELLDERNKRYEEIDVDNDYASQLCGMCADFARSGYKLSESTCGRCKSHP